MKKLRHRLFVELLVITLSAVCILIVSYSIVEAFTIGQVVLISNLVILSRLK